MDTPTLDLIAHLQSVCPGGNSPPVQEFCEAARRYLAEFRPQSVSWGRDQLFLYLSNGIRLSLIPPTTLLQGSMLPVAGQVVPVDPLASPDVHTQGAVLVTTGKATPPPGATDCTKPEGLQDRTLAKPVEHLNQPQPYSRKL